jgi:restriction system protein
VIAVLTFFLMGGLSQNLKPSPQPAPVSAPTEAANSPADPTRPGAIAPAASAQASSSTRSVLHTITQYAQYVMPIILLVIAGMRFGRRNEHETNAADSYQHAGPANSAKNRMSWGQFELLTLEVFRRRGYRMSERGTPASDGSMNLEVRKDGKKYVVHCKQWRAKHVAMGAVRELSSMMIVSNAAGGFVVTSGTFSSEVRAYVAGRNIQLIDGTTMREMLRDPETLAQYEEASIMPTGIAATPRTVR